MGLDNRLIFGVAIIFLIIILGIFMSARDMTGSTVVGPEVADRNYLSYEYKLNNTNNTNLNKTEENNETQNNNRPR